MFLNTCWSSLAVIIFSLVFSDFIMTPLVHCLNICISIFGMAYFCAVIKCSPVTNTFLKRFCETNPWLSSAPCLFKPTKQNEFLPHQLWLIISHKDQSGRTTEWSWLLLYPTTRRVIVYLLSERMQEMKTFCRLSFCHFIHELIFF